MCALLRFTINRITYAKYVERRRKLLGLLRNANSRITTILRHAVPKASKCNGVFVDFPICFAFLSSILRLVNAIHATRTLLALVESHRVVSTLHGEQKNLRGTKRCRGEGNDKGRMRSPRCVVVILTNDGNTESYLKFCQNRPTGLKIEARVRLSHGFDSLTRSHGLAGLP